MARKKKSLPRKRVKCQAKKISTSKKSSRRKTALSRNLSGKAPRLTKLSSQQLYLDFRQKGKEPSQWHDLDDNEIIAVIQKRDIEAYRELFFRYHKKLFTYVFHLVGNRDEIDDILQNVFSKTYNSIGNFDTSRKFSSWIYRIAHNETINFLKRKSKRYTVSWEDISTSKDKLDNRQAMSSPRKSGHNKRLPEKLLRLSKNCLQNINKS